MLRDSKKPSLSLAGPRRSEDEWTLQPEGAAARDRDEIGTAEKGFALESRDLFTGSSMRVSSMKERGARFAK